MNKHVSVRVRDVKWEKKTDHRWTADANQAECKRCRETASASAARTAKPSPTHATRTGFACRVYKLALCLEDCHEDYHEDLFRIYEEEEKEMVTSDEDDTADGEVSGINVEQQVDDMPDESVQLLVDGLSRRADKKAYADDADTDAGELTTDAMLWVPRLRARAAAARDGEHGPHWRAAMGIDDSRFDGEWKERIENARINGRYAGDVAIRAMATHLRRDIFVLNQPRVIS
ncbi:hypothetical protein CYMTET_41294 [Cymbomonas tetramitiformis]|uniref:Uncharacterized protein n=1 Tax=Cymbomonas tetramitiformis TaxID=36881 RepID=A0AAE0C6G3_9CHLO|nr:hypothetical protein CYMTET_41294 [Cymbomonas tetramitiformis]